MTYKSKVAIVTGTIAGTEVKFRAQLHNWATKEIEDYAEDMRKRLGKLAGRKKVIIVVDK